MASSTAAAPKRVLPRKLVGSFSVYLLTPMQAPFHLERTYVGFSTNPFHRRRQHNGEIKGGAWKTRRHRPWQIVCILTGFKDNISALQFEWLWQHPYKSKLARDVVLQNVKGKRGVGHVQCVKRKLIELFWILSSHFTKAQGLSLHFVSEPVYRRFEGDPLLVKLPSNIRVVFGEAPDILAELYLNKPAPVAAGDDDEGDSIEILADYQELDDNDQEEEDEECESEIMTEEDTAESDNWFDAEQEEDIEACRTGVECIDLVSPEPSLVSRKVLSMAPPTDLALDQTVVMYLTEDSDSNELVYYQETKTTDGDEDSLLMFDFRRPKNTRGGR